jgi:hypothetical protein
LHSEKNTARSHGEFEDKAFCNLYRRRATVGGETIARRVPGGWAKASANARLGAEVVRYAFLVEDLHPYSLPVSRRTQIKFELLQLIITYFVRTQQFR